jgi:hypothetical protein
MTVGGITPQALADLFRAAMRTAAASVSLVTARVAGTVVAFHLGALAGRARRSVGSARGSVTNLYRRGGPRLRHPYNFFRANRRRGARNPRTEPIAAHLAEWVARGASCDL